MSAHDPTGGDAALVRAGTTAGAVAAELRDLTVAGCDAFAAHHAPAWRLPHSFAGHAVAADVRADAIFTLGHLAAAGVTTIGGAPIHDALQTLLSAVDGNATNTFFSYRIAETLLEHGPFAANPLLSGFTAAQIEQVALACDSTAFVRWFDEGKLPRNYAAVLARCELARLRLGLTADDEVFLSLVERLRGVLCANPLRHLDDSHDASGRYDIYTADVWLFCEPLAPWLDGAWPEGLAAALHLVEHSATPDGTSVPWGRSTGILSIALTAELAAAALHHAMGDDAARWLRRALDATRSIPGWFGTDGVSSAHRHRDQDAYRGPGRRLQMTFDLYGKFAWAARVLAPFADTVHAATGAQTYANIDELVSFAPDSTASAWCVRRPGLAFTMPFVGAARSHYGPAPVAPGSFEAPVDRSLTPWVPLVTGPLVHHAGAGRPTTLAHAPGSVAVQWDSFLPTGDTFGTPAAPLEGTRTTRIDLDGRSVHVRDTVRLETPGPVAFLVPELATRPLTVTAHADVPHVVSTIEVDGIAEWRSAWSQIDRVHQLDCDPATTVSYSITVTPRLRVASTAHGHHYHESLYASLRDRVVDRPSPLGYFADRSVALDAIDVFHMHWPEWVAFDDLDTHRRMLDLLDDRGIPVVWTAHNLTPHSKEPERFDPVYALWASRARAVIHHSAWGEQRMRTHHEFASGTQHHVLPHGHFGALWRAALGATTRTEAETALGLDGDRIRIGIVGAPRAEKRLGEFLAAFAATRRSDLELAVWSLDPSVSVPDDPRIVVAEQYRMTDARTYALRLAACDLLAFPFDPHGEMLATGTVADAIGLGIPCLATDWGYLVETLGDAAIPLGSGNPLVATAALDALTRQQIDAAADAARARQAQYDWAPIADATLAVFEAAAAAGPID